MKRGVQGGVEAAQSLRSYVVESLSQKAVNLARGLGIMIYTYADVQKLATRYSKPGSSQAIELVKAQESIRDFCQGFNSAHPWSCFDDVSVSTSKKYQLRGE